MSTDDRSRVEEMLAEYRRSREQLDSIQHELAAIEERASSEDRSVEVTVGAQGTLSGLRLTDEAYRRHAPAELATVIVRLADEAAQAAATRAGAVLAPVLPSDTDPTAVLQGRADLSPAERNPAVQDDSAGGQNALADDESDGDLGEHSWLESSMTSQDAATRQHPGTKRTRS